MLVGIIGAMKIEVEGLLKIMTDVTSEKISGITFYKGKINNKNVVVATCGIGKVFSAVCAQTMIIKYNPSIILNTGVAGGKSQLTHIGDIVIGEAVVQHDMDTSPLGDPKGMICGLDIINIPCSENIKNKLQSVISNIDGLHYTTGVIATGDKFLSSSEDIESIYSMFNGIAFDMESASIGQVCYINNVDYGIIRSISDCGDENSSVDFMTFAKQAAETGIKVVKEFLDNL